MICAPFFILFMLTVKNVIFLKLISWFDKRPQRLNKILEINVLLAAISINLLLSSTRDLRSQ